ncbi:MAG: FadR/GntR family transcriptional regulator [Clostridia bacterium]|nr:FadR/GntR family transcriptional regulator [Clostridia bacterium]
MQGNSFRKASSARAFEDIVNQIQEAIISGRLKPGDRLPPERVLQQLFGVSRASIREAMRVLEGQGLIVVRPGAINGGAYVSETSYKHIVESLRNLMLLEQVREAELFEFRAALEGITAKWAAQRATEADLTRMAAALQSMAQFEEDWEAYWASDMAFHEAIAEASKNRVSLVVLKGIRDTMLRMLQDEFAGVIEKKQVLRMIMEDHFHIFNLISEGKDELVQQVMAEHVLRFVHRFKGE